MKNFKIDGKTVKKAFGVASVLLAGVSAIAEAVSERKKAQEFEDMKKALSELQNKAGES